MTCTSENLVLRQCVPETGTILDNTAYLVFVAEMTFPPYKILVSCGQAGEGLAMRD